MCVNYFTGEKAFKTTSDTKELKPPYCFAKATSPDKCVSKMSKLAKGRDVLVQPPCLHIPSWFCCLVLCICVAEKVPHISLGISGFSMWPPWKPLPTNPLKYRTQKLLLSSQFKVQVRDRGLLENEMVCFGHENHWQRRWLRNSRRICYFSIQNGLTNFAVHLV